MCFSRDGWGVVADQRASVHTVAMRPSIRSTRYRRLRALLRAARRNRGVTQAEVAQALGQPQSFMSKFESGERRLDVMEFIDLCKALGVDPRVVVAKLLAVDEAPIPSPAPGEGGARGEAVGG